MSFISAHPIATLTSLLVAAAAIFVLRFVIKIHRQDPTVWAGEMRRFDKFDRRDRVPNDVILFTGEERTDSAKAGDDLIRNEQNVVLLANTMHGLQPRRRWNEDAS